MKKKFSLAFILTLFYANIFAQIKQYNYQRELLDVKDEWHKIILPNEIFNKISPEFSDLRIFGLTTNNDTIEAPYILKIATEKITEKDVTFNLINQSQNNKGYYFTFEIPAETAVNEIKLDFKQQNFDWRLNLEGSQNQQEWFSLLEDYRILSIKNELTDFQFTKINFPNAKYRYFRLLITSKIKPELLSAKIISNEIIQGDYRNYTINSVKAKEEKQSKQTVIDIDLKEMVAVSNLKINVRNKFDFYRPVTIQYLSDSFKTEQGWKYNYSTLTSGMLNSIEKNAFVFNSTILKKLKIIIENNNNQPLQIDSVLIKGYIYELIARFNDPATYYLTYGNNGAEKPYYDIERFTDKIPATVTALKLGAEKTIKKDAAQKTEPLFKNKIWLWIIMALIILLLGGFSLKMMKDTK